MKWRLSWLFIATVLVLGVQVSPAQIYRDVTLDTSGITTAHTMPMGNTINDDFVVFYALFGTTLNLKTRVVHADGTLGPVRTVATTIAIGEQKRFDVAWNPRSKSYLLVYLKGGKLWGQKVKANGSKRGAPRVITTYTGRYWTVTSSVKKGFVLIISKGGNLVAQRLRSNGKKKKGEVTIVNSARDLLPFDSVSTETGTAFLVYIAHDTGTSKLYLRILRLNGKLQILGSSLVNVYGGMSSISGDAYCAYDPDDDLFGMAWRFGSAKTSFCIVNSSEYYVKAPTITSVATHPMEIIYNVAKFQFMIHYQKLNWFSGIDHTDYYYLPIKPNGDVVSSGNFIVRHDHENDGWGFGVSGIGSLMVVWTPEIGASSVFARLVIF